jgi:hypothetical protein
MSMPDANSETSATLAVASAFMKSRRRDWTSTGMTKISRKLA